LSSTEARHIVLEAPDGAAPGVGLWLAAIEDSRRRTLEWLADVEPELVDAPAPYHRHTIGSLLYHIALIEADWLFVEIREEPYSDEVVALFPDDDRDEQGRLTAVAGISLQEHLQRLARVRELLRATLMDMSDDEFGATRKIPGALVSTAWVVNHLMQHEAEHRGEIGQILDALRNQASPLR
jgi:uncharacterized damage-inducible protein DinB